MAFVFSIILSLFHCIAFKNFVEDDIVCTLANFEKNINNGGIFSNGNDNSCQSKKPADEDPVSSSKFKGILWEKNGQWITKIYEKSDFNSKLPWTDITISEPDFKDLYSFKDVFTRIKDGSYLSNSKDFIMCRFSKVVDKVRGQISKQMAQGKQLFYKKLTQSDVGNLNRLVIPKYFAITYLPQIPGVSSKGIEDGSNVKGIQLTFFDSQFKVWEFRYCCWKGSGSFTFSAGWNQFVKEKELKENDILIFYKCESKEEYMINIQYNRIEKSVDVAKKKVKESNLKRNCECSSFGESMEKNEKKRIKLFGVYIG